MHKVNFDSIQRKVLSASFTIGTCGGLFISAMKSLKNPYNILELTLQLLLLVIVGTGIGIITNYFSFKNKPPEKDNNTEVKFAERKIYFATIAVMVLSYFINTRMNEWNTFSAALIVGGVFILSLTNGIYDISSYATKKILSFGIFPVAVSFVLGYYVVGSTGAISAVWIFGCLFFLSFLLLLSNMQLNTQLFSTKEINVVNRKKIKLFNFGAVAVFFLLCLVIINFRKIISVSGDIIVKTVNWTYNILSKFTVWLLNNPQTGSESRKEIMELRDSTTKIVDKPILENLFILFLFIMLVFFIAAVTITIVVLIRKSSNNSIKKRSFDANEFNEESDIVKEKLRLKLRKKFGYTLEELDEIEDSGEKIRYLYGFILERLYHYDIDISKSDTPEEIINKILMYENGQELSEMGFGELTEKYRRVRYGKKNVDIDKELRQLGEVMEMAIRKLEADPPK